MRPIKVTVANYRSISEPVSFLVDSGQTAFTGPNNSGKSSLLRLFIECREIWNFFQTNEFIVRAHDRRAHGIGLQYVLDQQDPYNSRTKADAQIDIELCDSFA